MTTELLIEIRDELRKLTGLLSKPSQSTKPPTSGGTFAQRDNETLATCKYCQRKVIWRENKQGKKYTVNPDGAFHSTTCTR